MIDEWISAEFQRLSEVIEDYDPYLELQYIPPANRETQLDKKQCYRIIDTRNNKIVLFANELDTPVDILARLWDMDSGRGSVLTRLDTRNAAAQALKLREEIDKQEAAKDFATWVFKNEKNVWLHEGHKRDSEFRDLGSIRTVIDK